MKRFTTHAPSLLPVLLTAAALVVAVGVSSCSRSGVTDSITGPSHSGAIAFAKGRGNGGNVPPPAPPPVAANPCTNLTGFGGAVVATAASVPQNRAGRLRIEIAGDLAAGTLGKIASCSTVAPATVTFVSGTATVTGGGLGVSDVFGVLAPVPGETGVVLATAANGDVLEIIWPALAVPPVAGPPIIRVQLASSGQAGSTLSVSASIVGRTANGATATFTASASNLVIPALR